MEEMIITVSHRKSYWRLSGDFMLEEKGYGAELFHTYCTVGPRAFATTIDHYSSINAVGIDMVEKLELSTTSHPRPYSLKRYRDTLDVRSQTMVLFSVGKFSCEILCDVIPVPMVACHLLLGEPWYKMNMVAYDYLANTYTVTQDNVYVLKPMEKKMFKSWRKGRLLMMKKQKEATNKEGEAATIFSAPGQSIQAATIFSSLVQSIQAVTVVLKTDSKPRTVSFEEGEDDTATPDIITGPIEFEPTYLQVMHTNEDELVQTTHKHPVALDMDTYTIWTKPDSIFPYAYMPNHQAISMHVHGSSKESVQSIPPEEIFHGANRRDQIVYYFGSPRPPEKAACNRKLEPMKSFSLKSSGWGPPAK
jgi:hypothetical protein